jgi:hypothetical protein
MYKITVEKLGDVSRLAVEKKLRIFFRRFEPVT